MAWRSQRLPCVSGPQSAYTPTLPGPSTRVAGAATSARSPLDICIRTRILITMPRPRKFDDEQVLAAAGRLIARNGPSGATIGAIARAVGAPTGSIYHRFDSRDVLLARVWLGAAAAFQAAFFERLAGQEPREAGLAAALYMAQRVREHPREARLLRLHRREDF